MALPFQTRMLEGQLEAGEPKEDTHPEDPCPGAGPDTEKTAVAAEVPGEDSNAGEMPEKAPDFKNFIKENQKVDMPHIIPASFLICTNFLAGPR
ncbi:hypothetical protein P7K49_008987 [Saguinus oedipus]|uniref:Uncharacterized protein n=1 Tax=Saguinus oedipus TaxID=9490 RepID=A0ABQ9VZB7_SAGOE|nr:hypothetical protein P7K49_008987 [Saguinus oedipus]